MTLQEQYDEHFGDILSKYSYIEGHAYLSEITEETIKVMGEVCQPTNLLEIGFNAGHSTFAWLTLFPNLRLGSLDICKHKYTLPCVKKMQELFGDRFKFGNVDSQKLKAGCYSDYDAVFIDGDHSNEGVTHDYKTCSESGVKHIIIDDYDIFRYIRQLSKHIDESEHHPYKQINTYSYDNELSGIGKLAKSECVIFRRNA